jgi:hypothetical protein
MALVAEADLVEALAPALVSEKFHRVLGHYLLSHLEQRVMAELQLLALQEPQEMQLDLQQSTVRDSH